jgi:deazaflavin-dependent oxidoreductase (nitroreductase family)
MPTAGELISPASIQDLARVLRWVHPASPWGSVREHVTPMMYLPHDTDPDLIHVFATKARAPANPGWHHNLAAAGDGSAERGTGTCKVTVRELTGAERDRIHAGQARRYPGFAQYARQTAAARTIPALELRRA